MSALRCGCVLLVFLALSATSCVAPVEQTPAAAVRKIETKSGVAMVLLPGGEFMMGSTSGDADEAPWHKVVLSPFAMDVFEVQQREYAELELPDPSNFKGAERPVEQIRWSDAALFCNERSRREKLEPCYDEATFACDFAASGYRLPTEAEWEYAARCGAETDYDFGNQPRQLKNFACYAGNGSKRTEPAGSKKPNRWGLFDLYGNVAEWCQDVYSAEYYASSPTQDPRGPAEGRKRVMRGGSWKSGDSACRATARVADFPGITDACFAQNTYGFRCVRRWSRDELPIPGPDSAGQASDDE